MLGHVRRTTRLDVGLALAFTGIAYLVWVLVAWATRGLVADMVSFSAAFDPNFPPATRIVRIVFVDAGVAIDLVGILWLVVSMFLIIYASRQKFSISWAWMSGLCQATVAALGGVLVAWAVHLPYQPVAAQRPGGHHHQLGKTQRHLPADPGCAGHPDLGDLPGPAAGRTRPRQPPRPQPPRRPANQYLPLEERS